MQANRATMENSVEISLKTGNRTAKIAHISHASKVLLKILQAINAGEGVEKREPSYTAGGNAN